MIFNVVWIATGIIAALTLFYVLFANFCRSTGSALANPLLLDVESGLAFCKWEECPGYSPDEQPVRSNDFHRECVIEHCKKVSPELFAAITKTEERRRRCRSYNKARQYNFPFLIRNRRKVQSRSIRYKGKVQRLLNTPQTKRFK